MQQQVRHLRPWLVGVLIALIAMVSLAAAQTVFGDKLGFVPVNAGNNQAVRGTGWVRATLDGTTLTVEGAFENLGSPATAAHIHFAARGQNGPVVFPLEFGAGTAGTLSGTFELSATHLEALMAVQFYVNVHSELNPAGEVRAWLVPIE